MRQFRFVSTARGRTAHLTAFFGRAARAAALTTHQIRQYQLARRAAGAATGTINRETSALHRMGTLAVHWGWLDTVFQRRRPSVLTSVIVRSRARDRGRRRDTLAVLDGGTTTVASRISAAS